MAFFRKHAHLFAIIIILSLVYGFTLAPGLTWENRGADGGDLITATAAGGVPHPSGYPTYMIIARLFQFLPVGELAFRTNLMSAVCGLFSAVLVAALAHKSYVGAEHNLRYAAFLAGLAFGLSPLLWSQAIITEVYALHALFVALILTLTPLSGEFSPKWRPWLDRLGGLISGLAVGNQLTIVFMLPPWLLAGVLKTESGQRGESGEKWHGRKENWISQLSSRVDWHALIRRMGWMLLGLSVYFTLPLRARSGSPVNWGNPVDFQSFWWLVSGQLYQDRLFTLSPEYVIQRVRNWAGWLQTQYGLIGLVIGFFGLFFCKPRSKRFFWITGWMMLAYSTFAIGYASFDSYTLLIPAFMAFGLWFGLGVVSILEMAARTRWSQWLIPVGLAVFSGLVAVNVWMNYSKVDASQDQYAETFLKTVIQHAPGDAILLTEEDEDSFSLLYAHFALGKRPDLAVVVKPLLQFDWYHATLNTIYPDLNIPGTLDDSLLDEIRASHDRPVCQVTLNPTFETCPDCVADAAKMLNCDR